MVFFAVRIHDCCESVIESNKSLSTSQCSMPKYRGACQRELVGFPLAWCKYEAVAFAFDLAIAKERYEGLALAP